MRSLCLSPDMQIDLATFLPNRSAVSCITKSLEETPPSTLRPKERKMSGLNSTATHLAGTVSEKYPPVMHCRWKLNCISSVSVHNSPLCYVQYAGWNPNSTITYWPVSCNTKRLWGDYESSMPTLSLSEESLQIYDNQILFQSHSGWGKLHLIDH